MELDRIWLTTDTHFNHDKVIEYCGRPKDFEDRISSALKALPPETTLIHLGDVCIGEDEAVHWSRVFPLREGRMLILVRGNHDKKSASWYMSHGWHLAVDGLLLEAFGKRIYLSHQPVDPAGGFFDINIHGHFHNTAHRKAGPTLKFYDPEKVHRLIALEHEYRPILLRDVIDHPEKFRSIL